MYKPNPNFPVGAICHIENWPGERVEVIDWEPFYAENQDIIDKDVERFGADSPWLRYIPVREENGGINGYYPEVLVVDELPKREKEIAPSEIEVIEI